LRKPFTKEELDIVSGKSKIPTRTVKNHIAKIEEKTYTSTMNQYSAIFTRFNDIQEKMKMSSKHNTSNNLLFGQFEKKETNSVMNYFTNKNKTEINNLINIENVPEDFSFHDSKKKIHKRIITNDGNNSNMTLFSMNRELEEEQILSEKIKEIKSKKNKIKGLTSIHLNREHNKILVNSMSHSQYVYDTMYYDRYTPLELKGHTSSFFVKSVLSPCGNYALSGSNDAIINIWKINNCRNNTFSNINDKAVKLSNFHKHEVS
jgi:WD40 repeat protein